MMVRGDVYYLMYSGGSYDRPIYAIGYATSDSPMGRSPSPNKTPSCTRTRQTTFWAGAPQRDGRSDGALWMFYHTKVKVEVSGSAASAGTGSPSRMTGGSMWTWASARRGR